MQLTRGKVPVLCLESKCNSHADYDTLTTMLPLEECARYAKLLAERHLLSNSDTYAYCPNVHCKRLLRIDGERTS